MSAMIELERIVVDRRIMRALHTVLQSQRASLLEKQEAEFALMRHQHLELKDIAKSAEEEEVAMKGTSVSWRIFFPALWRVSKG